MAAIDDSIGVMRAALEEHKAKFGNRTLIVFSQGVPNGALIPAQSILNMVAACRQWRPCEYGKQRSLARR